MPALDTGLNPIGFEPYDKALKDFFTINFYPDPQGKESITLIPVMGPPRLENSTQEALSPTGERPKGDNPKPQGTNPTRMNRTVRLPAISLTQLDWQLDLIRWTRADFRKLKWTEDGNRVIQNNALLPVRVMYQVDLWTNYRTHMNQLLRAVMTKFYTREVWLPVDLKGPWGVRNIALYMDEGGPVNTTDLEPADKDRTIRMSMTFIFKAWIIPDAKSLPTVRKVVRELYVANKNVTPYPALSDTLPYTGWTKESKKETTSAEILPEDENP